MSVTIVYPVKMYSSRLGFFIAQNIAVKQHINCVGILKLIVKVGEARFSSWINSG